MGSVWLKNFFGLKQTQFELLQVPNPKTEHCIHVTLRCAQAGTVLGSLLGPLVVFLNSSQTRKSSSAEMRDAFTSGGINGALIGTLVGTVMSAVTINNMNSVQLYDKCYRARYDTDQLTFDRTCVLGAALGSLSSGSFGLVVGVDLALLISNVLSAVRK
ncbi:unnamed protein product [Anisakis simplex]|uniref:Transmembrane protein 65 n=1 Tax=Anisakis simplex TaxID=6269 RepID=A0A0M3KEK1_ANISI|nr:unnamed protein product [Anisakis simplex]